MKTLGMIGGMSPESTVSYYHIINREVNRRLGANHSAEILLYSIDFETIAAMQRTGDWQQAGEVLAAAAVKLAAMGAQAVVLATNTMHKVASAIEQAVDIPLIHVVDVTAESLKRQGLNKVGLLGTRFTMNDDFYTERARASGIKTIVPSEPEQEEIHRIIFEELCLNRFTESAKAYYLGVMERLAEQGAQGIVFGCTEIGLLLSPQECPLPVFDSAQIHALAAVEFVLS